MGLIDRIPHFVAETLQITRGGKSNTRRRRRSPRRKFSFLVRPSGRHKKSPAKRPAKNATARFLFARENHWLLAAVAALLFLGLAAFASFGPPAKIATEAASEAVSIEPEATGTEEVAVADPPTEEAPRANMPTKVAIVAEGAELDQTDFLKGMYVSYAALGNEDFLNRMKKLLEETELNAIVMDFKGDRGMLTFPTQVPLAIEIGADAEPTVKDAAAFLEWFRSRGVRTIARIVVFKDNLLATEIPSWAVIDSATGGAWHDYPEKMAWVDPNLEGVRAYNVALAVEAAELGFDQVQFDYTRFPTDGALSRTTFSVPSTYESRTAALVALFSATHDALRPYGVELELDVFGYTTWVNDDLGIGQDIDVIAPYLDSIAPMLYPSTFNAGLSGEDPKYRSAIEYPYEIVNKSTLRAVRRAKEVNPNISIRPWIQDFQDYAFDWRIYTPDEIRSQMYGVLDGGGHGWYLWDPANQYTREALVSAEPSFTPNTAGRVPVLAYGDVGTDVGSGGVTADQLRADLQLLLDQGFYPINVRDMVPGKVLGVPAGKRPVALTFDGSTAGHLRMSSNGAVDTATAAGVIKAFHDDHPADWPLRATFFVRTSDGNEPGDDVFGKGDLAAGKLQLLASWGMEIGALPPGAERIDGLDAVEVQRRLSIAESQLEKWAPGYDVVSLALPAGAAPRDSSLLKNGAQAGTPFNFSHVVTLGDSLAPSPATSAFDPLKIPRVRISAGGLKRWIEAANRPGASFVSPGE